LPEECTEGRQPRFDSVEKPMSISVETPQIPSLFKFFEDRYLRKKLLSSAFGTGISFPTTARGQLREWRKGRRSRGIITVSICAWNMDKHKHIIAFRVIHMRTVLKTIEASPKHSSNSISNNNSSEKKIACKEQVTL